MIFCFPNLDTLRLALTTDAVPTEVSQKPAAIALDEEGRLWLQPVLEPDPAVEKKLRRLNVQAVKTSPVPLNEEVECWLQVFPLQRVIDMPAISDKAAVLFDLPAEQLTSLVSEMLRLGNDRQGFRYLDDGTVAGGAGRVLLRVTGPPYYSLLRALDCDGQTSAPVAYIEIAPRVWVQIGYQHPLGPQLAPAEKQVLLLRPPRQWTFLQEAPFRDIYEVLEFQLPQAKTGWQEGKLPGRLMIPLRLGQGSGTDIAEMWVLHDRPFEQLDALVHSADDQLLGRLVFAVGDRADQQVIVLRVRPSKQPPPVLTLQAVEFCTHWRLDNLFVPCRTTLQPPLRRDAVRKLLADNPDVITWLYPQGDGKFIPETLPDSAFRPLSDWIDYVLEHDHQELALWLQSTQFDFESFVCKDDQPAKPKPPSADRPRSPRRKPQEQPAGEEPVPEASTPTEKSRRKQRETVEDFAEIKQIEPSLAEKELRQLEEHFRGLHGPSNIVEKQRQSLWPRMAELNATLGNRDDASLCWMNALWPMDSASAAWCRRWYEVETGTEASQADLSEADLDRVLTSAEPSTTEVRTLTAYVIWAAHCAPPAPVLLRRLNPCRLFLEAHENTIPVRAVWLAWVSLAKVSGGDMLILARARDRLLERLFKNGLRPEQDLPTFLRFAGQPTSARFRNIRQWIGGLYEMARAWVGGGSTRGYVDLMFAFGLACLGEREASRQLLTRAEHVLARADDDVHKFLLRAFRYRLEQAQERQPHRGPLPEAMMQELRRMATEYRKAGTGLGPAYYIDRLRQHSRILEPDQIIQPYRRSQSQITAADRALAEAELADTIDREELAARIRRLIRSKRKEFQDPKVRAQILRAILDQAARAGEELALEVLTEVVPTFQALPSPEDKTELKHQADLLEKGLFLAAHFDQPEQFQELFARFRHLLQASAASAVESLDSLVGACFRSLRKFGLRREVDIMLREMAEFVLRGRTLFDLPQLAKQAMVEGPLFGPPEWRADLRALLPVAAGWYYFGREREAHAVLQATRTVLLVPEPTRDEQLQLHGDQNALVMDRSQLACAYATMLGQAPPDLARRGFEEIFQKLKALTDTKTTSGYYLLYQLNVVEAVVRAVVSDDFVMGADARRWLDEDEFVVRRRIHQDVRAIMSV